MVVHERICWAAAPSRAERVFEHIRNRTTDVSDEVWREPIANYQSPSRLAAEIDLLRRTPVPFCPSAAIQETGAYVAREAAGTPLLVLRDEEGGVRAFRNACRHRGMQLADGSGCSRGFVCRYHGWTYGLNGQLRHIPDEHGFPGLEKERHGLVPVAAEERLGLVFVTQEESPQDSTPWEEMPELIGREQRMMSSTEMVCDINWKVFLEGFLEGYHIRSTHRDTFYPMGFDNLNVVETCGRNSRLTFPFRRIQKLADVAPEERRLKGFVTYVYHLFPNALVAELSHHTNLVVLEPVSIDKTRMVAYALAECGDDPESIEAAKRDANFVNDTGGAEDREVAGAIQRSMNSGANEFFTFGRFEGAIAHFHRNLTAALEKGSIAG